MVFLPFFGGFLLAAVPRAGVFFGFSSLEPVPQSLESEIRRAVTRGLAAARGRGLVGLDRLRVLRDGLTYRIGKVVLS